MIAVISEVWPNVGRKEEYFALSVALRPPLKPSKALFPLSVLKARQTLENTCHFHCGAMQQRSRPGEISKSTV